MTDYATLEDNKLLELAQNGDREAEEALAERYLRLVRACARPLFLAGGDSEDLIQEGTFGLLSAKQKKVTKNAITIAWNKLKGAKTYVIYGNKCGKTNRYKYITTVSSTSYTQKKLKSGTYYKYLVTAFDKKGKSIAAAKTLHIATTGGKAGNFAKVTTAAKKDKVTLAKKGKTFKLKVKKTKGSGNVTYKKVKGTKLIKVTKGGKVKVSRKCRKGKTYTIKVRATAKKNKNYNSAKRTQKVKIVVK
jgi:fibronectin type 3 domain-containing protein